MPVYLQPGVYVEDTEPGIEPTAGAVPSIDAVTLGALAAELRRAIRIHVPNWTDSNESDPGITLVEVFAFLAESLLFRSDQIPERGRPAARRAAAALAALGHDRAACSESLKRPLFFAGRLLDAATLTAEQEYHREKLRRHDRALLGYGVVSGLAVRVEPAAGSGGSHVVIEPGYAIDPNGEEVSIPCVARVPPLVQSDTAFVTLRFWEHPCPLTAATDGLPSGMPAIEEACVIGVNPEVIAPAFAFGASGQVGGPLASRSKLRDTAGVTEQAVSARTKSDRRFALSSKPRPSK
jgi:hypothetical protein